MVDVVLGASATSSIGAHLVPQLVAAGRTVKAASRSGDYPESATVSAHKVDAADAEAVAALLQGAARVFVTIGVDYPKWPTVFPPIIDGVLAACKATKTPLIFCDNVFLIAGSNPSQMCCARLPY